MKILNFPHKQKAANFAPMNFCLKSQGMESNKKSRTSMYQKRFTCLSKRIRKNKLEFDSVKLFNINFLECLSVYTLTRVYSGGGK